MIAQLTALLPDDQRHRMRGYLAFVAVGTLIRGAAAVTLVPLIRELVSDRASKAWPWVALLTALTVAGWLIDHQANRRGFATGSAMVDGLYDRLVDRLGSVPIGWFTSDHTTATRQTISGVGQELYSAMGNLIAPVLVATFLPYVIAVLLLPICWPVGLVALACAPLLHLARSGGNRLLKGADERAATAHADVDQRVVEYARTQPVLRAAGRAGAEGSALDDALAEDRRAGVGLIGWAIPGQVLFGLASQIALLALVLTTVSQWSAGNLTVPEAIAVFVVIVRYLEPFTEVADLAPAVGSLRATLGRVHTLLATPTLPVAAHPATVEVSGGQAPDIDLVDVDLAAGDQTVLDGVSFLVPGGSTTAVVGPSGAGKTTILSLIARFRDVDGGAVRVGGHDVRDLDPTDLLRLLGIVFQDVYLFAGSIADNVRHGRPDATDEEVTAAAAVARVDEIVARLPDGWDTQVGEGGAALSGGERQRISIARALLKDAPVLLLDEATSAIDAENEVAVRDAIAAGDRARTVVIVAHRQQTIAHADHVVFVDQGKVIEAGTPEDLIAAGGRFATYWHDRRDSEGWVIRESTT